MTVREIVREPLRFLSKINKSKEIELVDNALNAVHLKPLKYADRLLQKFLNKWTIFLFCSILFSSNQKEH